MIWMSDLLEAKQQRLAAGPVQHGHLQVFEGGKLADGTYVEPPSLWHSIRSWLVRDKARPRLRPIKLGEKKGLAMQKWMSVEHQGRKVIEAEEGSDA
jgi:hypothetical protein